LSCCWRWCSKWNCADTVEIQAVEVMSEVKCIAVDKKGEFSGVGGNSKAKTLYKLSSILNATKFSRLGMPIEAHGIHKHRKSYWFVHGLLVHAAVSSVRIASQRISRGACTRASWSGFV
jgi:hypothetical protein